MYKLPKESHLLELIGQSLNLVSVGPYHAKIVFEKGLVLEVLHKLEVELDDKKSLWFDFEWISTKDIHNILMKEVVNISNESELVLKISLAGGTKLYIHTEISQYDSIRITRADGSLEVI